MAAPTEEAATCRGTFRTTSNPTDVRAHFSELLARVRAGEEIVITKGSEPHARLVPPSGTAEREPAPLRHLGLPDNLLDGDDPEQAAIDAGECTDSLGIWRGSPAAS